MTRSDRRAKLARIADAAAGHAAVGHPKFPWRSRPTPYRTLVAEFFLQRTGAVQASGPYCSFVKRYPSFRKLTSASEAEVLAALEPLGLRHRARTFTALIRSLSERHSGRIPRNESALLALPGIGRYTARAVLCFALGEPYGVVDVNTARVLCRAVSGRKVAPERPGTNRRLLALANEVAEAAHDARFSQWGLLDIGREICTEDPQCARCPLHQDCAYLARKRSR
jgi:A/G-specific adenine glycosylase